MPKRKRTRTVPKKQNKKTQQKDLTESEPKSVPSPHTPSTPISDPQSANETSPSTPLTESTKKKRAYLDKEAAKYKELDTYILEEEESQPMSGETIPGILLHLF